MLKKWLSILCIFLPALLVVFAAHAMADASVCASGATLNGVDVSGYQNSQSWPMAQQSGRQFAFVKATQGTTDVSANFQKDWAGTGQAGVLRGSYHYFQPSEDPTAQADFYLSTTGTLGSQDLPPMFDWEITDSTANDQIIARAQVWLSRVEQATGRTPIIYTSPAYWKQIGEPAGFDRYPLFIADYGVNCPTVPFPWKTWTFWQHSIGAVAGIQNNTDQDFFNGLLAALKAL